MIYMEDVNSMAGKAIEILITELKKFDIVMTVDQEDSIYDGMTTRLEHIAGYPDYRHQM